MMIPMNDAPPTVAVFLFFSIRKASIFPVQRQTKRSKTNMVIMGMSGADKEPSNMIATETANNMAVALKKPYQVKFQPCQ